MPLWVLASTRLPPLTRVGVTVWALWAISSTVRHGYGHFSVTYNYLAVQNLTPNSVVGSPYLKSLYLIHFFFLLLKIQDMHTYLFFTSSSSSSSSAFPRSLLPLNFQPCAGYEFCCRFQISCISPEFVLQGSPLRPQLDSEVMMEGTVLQDMLWGVWACLTRAVRCGRQPQAIQVGTQSAVPSA